MEKCGHLQYARASFIYTKSGMYETSFKITQIFIHKLLKQYPWQIPTDFSDIVILNDALLCLNQMLYALCLSYHSNTDVLFACLSSGWATKTGRMLGPKVGNSIKCLFQEYSDALPHRESNQGFATIRLLVRRLY